MASQAPKRAAVSFTNNAMHIMTQSRLWPWLPGSPASQLV